MLRSFKRPAGVTAQPKRFGYQLDGRRSQFAPSGFTLVELLVVIAIIGILIGLLLPAVAAVREAARNTECSNQLRQMGLALHNYNQSQSHFPSGYQADISSEQDGKGWGWGALVLPFIEQSPLAEQLGTMRLSLSDVSSDVSVAGLLRTNVGLYRCPSDVGGDLSHEFRTLVVPSDVENLFASTQKSSVFYHILPPEGPGQLESSIQIAKSNYVASFGDQWAVRIGEWSESDYQGNGMFGRNSDVTIAMISDGTSNTLAVGERSFENYAAVWAGVNSSRGCGFADNQMVLGTAFYPINDDPVLFNLGCDGRGSANFSSFHPGGANFVFGDGSVHFLSDRINSRSGEEGVFQNLAQRNDGEVVGEF